jgi:tRNA pseudouridine38-40 synthase
MKYLMKLSYVGTHFCGFQYQPNARTVQSALNEAFTALFGVACKVTSCSRTDSGGHAIASSLTVELPDGTTPIPAEKLPLAVARFMPPDVSVYDAVLVPDTFHVRHDVVSKEYVYKLHNGKTQDPFLVGRAWFYPKRLSDDALARMREAAKHLIGTHDFAAFMAEGSPVATTVRTMFACDVEKEGDMLSFRVRGDGFLYNMVRIIVCTLVEVGHGRISPEDMPAIIASCDRTRAGMTAPPEGLYLARVLYE